MAIDAQANEVSALDSIPYWAEVSESAFHGGWEDGKYNINFYPWDLVWRETPVPPEHARFASLFRLDAGVYEYCDKNLVKETKGAQKGSMRASIEGFRQGRPGLVGVDIDRRNLDTALEDARRIVRRLLDRGVRQDAFRCFFSGSKGFSLHLLADAFGPALDEVEEGRLPRHERQALLALSAVCGGVTFDPGSRQTIRLFRLPNSRHQTSGLCKVPLTPEELDRMSIAKITSLARAPREDIPLVPSAVPDEALMALLREVVASEAQKAEVDAEHKASACRARGGDAPTANTFALSLSSPSPFPKALLDRVRAKLVPILDPNTYLPPGARNHWHSAPVPNRDTTASGHDFHLARELFLMEQIRFTFEEIEAAIWLRPGSSAYCQRNEEQALRYIRRTVAKALEFAESAKARRIANSPVGKARAPLVEVEDLTASWIYNSRLWRPRTGLGKWGRDVFLFHLNVARNMVAFDPQEGQWSQTYFVSLRTLSDSSIALASMKTARKHQELLKAIGLLKLIRTGKREEASSYRVYVPRQQEEVVLIRGAQAAKMYLTGRTLNRENIRVAKVIAKRAMGQ